MWGSRRRGQRSSMSPGLTRTFSLGLIFLSRRSMSRE